MSQQLQLNCSSNIVGILTTPEYTDPNDNNAPIYNTSAFATFNSNHVVALVRSISGLAIDKPPQDNQIILQDSFGYKLFCMNESTPHMTFSGWQSKSYNLGDEVTFLLDGETSYWQASGNTQPSDIPASSSIWHRLLYPQEIDDNSHELRITFEWPL